MEMVNNPANIRLDEDVFRLSHLSLVNLYWLIIRQLNFVNKLSCLGKICLRCLRHLKKDDSLAIT